MFDEEWDLDVLDEDDSEDSQSDRFLTFSLAGVMYGIELRYVREFVAAQMITPLPGMPAYVKGLINLRGQVVPVLDMRLRFHLEERAYDQRTTIIIVECEEDVVGLIVDTVDKVLLIPQTSIEPPTGIAKTADSRFIAGMGKVERDVKVLLNLKRLLYDF